MCLWRQFHKQHYTSKQEFGKARTTIDEESVKWLINITILPITIWIVSGTHYLSCYNVANFFLVTADRLFCLECTAGKLGKTCHMWYPKEVIGHNTMAKFTQNRPTCILKMWLTYGKFLCTYGKYAYSSYWLKKYTLVNINKCQR